MRLKRRSSVRVLGFVVALLCIVALHETKLAAGKQQLDSEELKKLFPDNPVLLDGEYTVSTEETLSLL